MKFFITILLIVPAFFCTAQDSIHYKVNIPYRPATVKLLNDSVIIATSYIVNTTKYNYINFETGAYSLQISCEEHLTDSIYNIVVKKGQILVIDFTSEGPCLYDRPKGYIPVCPKNHKDNIVPIHYGFRIKSVEYTKGSKDMTYKAGGCVITNCDPQFYCKEHDIEF